MGKYTVCITYNARYITEVVADNEGDALAKAREEAENADARQFSILEETNTNISEYE